MLLLERMFLVPSTTTTDHVSGHPPYAALDPGSKALDTSTLTWPCRCDTKPTKLYERIVSRTRALTVSLSKSVETPVST